MSSAGHGDLSQAGPGNPKPASRQPLLFDRYPKSVMQIIGWMLQGLLVTYIILIEMHNATRAL